MSSLITGFHHVCLKTRDWDRTLAFYVTALGFTEKITWRTAPNRAAMFDTGDGNYLEVFEDLAYVPAANGAVIHFALRTSHLDQVAARVRAT
ncbi:MAG: VOC family protein, partial [Opitutaceae bacterium]